MNKATSLVTALLVFQKDACSIDLAEKEAGSPRPAVISVSFYELTPGNSQLISDASRLHQAQANLKSGAANTAAEARDEMLPLLTVAAIMRKTESTGPNHRTHQ